MPCSDRLVFPNNFIFNIVFCKSDKTMEYALIGVLPPMPLHLPECVLGCLLHPPTLSLLLILSQLGLCQVVEQGSHEDLPLS